MLRRPDSSPSATRSSAVTRMRSAACWLTLAIALVAAGCQTAPKVTYLRATDKTVHLKAGEPAPHDGWLLSNDRMAEIYDLLDRKAPPAADALP